jgi:dihydrodipicolinate synthase/N-acetylneuraminate lyase
VLQSFNVSHIECGHYLNLSNDTLLRLAERRNMVGVKDSSGSIVQSLELITKGDPPALPGRQ